ncbi:hypothetical protein [Shewanella algae]|uniref:hypothetical protein n=1 Tax=Shewanella algae TaxID=38313 RepID=UPI001642CB5E|nr:hypothetical protein [Shewanella algae]
MKRFMLQLGPENSSRAEIRQIPDYIDDTGKKFGGLYYLAGGFSQAEKGILGVISPSDGRSSDEEGENLSIFVGKPIDYRLVTGNLCPAGI